MDKVKFLDLSIGSTFKAHGKVWVRTDYAAATVLNEQNSCNFTIDAEDEYVEPVDLVALLEKAELRPTPFSRARNKVLVRKSKALRQTERAMETAMDERNQLLDFTTKYVDEHPEGYEGPCLCKECLSYSS